jgi:heme/copper-type cytochrome/quinol oxidase subunit 1
MPRRIPDYPDAFAAWNILSSFGSLISVSATALLCVLIYNIFSQGTKVSNNPWAIPSYFADFTHFQQELESSSTLEWALESPIPFHAYKMLPIQS